MQPAINGVWRRSRAWPVAESQCGASSTLRARFGDWKAVSLAIRRYWNCLPNRKGEVARTSAQQIRSQPMS